MRFWEPEWHAQLPSTNTAMLDRLKAGEDLSPGFVLAAREQTAGRGRYDRRWLSRPGRDLTFSFLLVVRPGENELPSLPMAAALAVVSTLEGLGVRARTKWPNDVLVDGRKICGILAERCAHPHRPGEAVVVGMGVNVNLEAAAARAIGRPATSIRIETGRVYGLEETLGRVLAALPEWVERWETGGFSALREDWIARCCFVGERVVVGEGENRRSGVLAGFGDVGQLLLREGDGRVREIWSGDVA